VVNVKRAFAIPARKALEAVSVEDFKSLPLPSRVFEFV
jgi:hypothetical protein